MDDGATSQFMRSCMGCVGCHGKIRVRQNRAVFLLFNIILAHLYPCHFAQLLPDLYHCEGVEAAVF